VETTNGNMTVSELASLSETPLSTIKFYIRENLMARPKKTRGTRAYYDSRHLNRLKLIKKIQAEGNVSLAKVREIIGLIDDGDMAKAGAGVRDEIISAAIAVFREKGYEKTTIADIVAAAQIGRSTFYSNFKNKKELLLACIRPIIFGEMQKGDADELDDIKDEADILSVIDKRARAYFNVNPLWVDMVRVLRTAALNDPEEFAESLDEALHLKIDLLKRGLEKGVRHDFFRDINSTLMTVMLLGLQDYHGYLSKEQPDKTLEELYDDAKDIMLYGILKR
jgi:AcrR family transcriptional regulator